MTLLASRGEEQIWLEEISRPFHLGDPFSGEPYVCILFTEDESVLAAEKDAVGEQLVRSDCRYAVCAGHECANWHDWIDEAALALGDFEADDARFVMTTWHEDETTEDIVFFALTYTQLGPNPFRRFLVLIVGNSSELRPEIERAIRAVWNPPRPA